MAINLRPVDVALIGLGAANGVAVLPLARAGLRIAALEAGAWMKPGDFKPDEIRNNVRHQVTTGRKVAGEIPTFRTSPDEIARPAAQYHNMMNAVGGTSIHYYANHWRFSPWDFRARSETIRRYGAGALPAGTTLEDWPLTYEDLEPFYDITEYEIGVSGKAGNLKGAIDPAGNVFEGPRQREYPMPPLRSTDFTELVTAAARSVGFHAHMSPAAINTREYGGRPGCVYHGYCDTGGCHIGAKNSTAVSTIPAAMKTKNLTIFEYAHVTRIVTDAHDRASGVLYIRDGKEYFQPAKAVLLGSYAYENSRLLLLSKSKAFPTGLANRHGQVGRHFITHWASRDRVALFPRDLNLWYGAMGQAIMVNDWADDNFDHAGLGFIGGAGMQVSHEIHPIAAASMPTFGKTPRTWGSAWKHFVHENASRWTGVFIQCNTLPYENTWLDLDFEVKDPLGDPVCRITSGPKDNERRAAAFVAAKAEAWLRAAGAIEVITPPGAGAPPKLSNHAAGGTRMGDNPETNVVDRWGFAHEVPNLGIVGASVMGTHGARNPTGTVQALAWRTADRLVKNWKSIAG